MTKPTDDLEAVRIVAEALQGFDAQDQERIIRWAREKIGLVPSPAVQPSTVREPILATAGFGRPVTPVAIPPIKDTKRSERPLAGVPEAEQAEEETEEAEEEAIQEATEEKAREEKSEEVEQPVERSGAVNLLIPTEEKKNRVFMVFGIILLTIAVALLIVMITYHAK